MDIARNCDAVPRWLRLRRTPSRAEREYTILVLGLLEIILNADADGHLKS